MNEASWDRNTCGQRFLNLIEESVKSLAQNALRNNSDTALFVRMAIINKNSAILAASTANSIHKGVSSLCHIW